MQLIAAPEVNQVLPEIPVLGDLVKNLYECHYDKFFVALGTSSSIHPYPFTTANLPPQFLSSYPRTDTPYSLTHPLTTRKILCTRDAYPGVFSTPRVLPQLDPRESCRCVRRQCPVRRQVQPFL